MELNNLLSKTKKLDEDTKKYYAIEIGQEYLKTALWQVVGTRPEVISVGSTQVFGLEDPEDFIRAADRSLSEASQTITEEPDEIIFSFPESWVEAHSIADDKKPLLKQLTEKLELKPIGFVVTPEAIVHFLKAKEGGPFTGILVELSDQELSVALCKNGHIEGTQTVGRSDDLSADVQEGLARFKEVEVLPPRILLTGGKSDLDTEKQQLTSFEWQEKLPFLHIPKIETCGEFDSITAVVSSGGAEVIKALEVSPSPTLVKTQHTKSKKEPESEEIPDLSEEFGFQESDNLVAAKIPVSSSREQEDEDEDEDPIEIGEEEVEEVFESPSNRFHFPKITFASISFPKIVPRNQSAVVVLVAAFFLLTSISIGFAYWYIPKATVTIHIQPQTINREVAFIVSTTATEPEIDQNVIPGVITAAEASGQSSTPATGEKTVGDRAKGKVTLYNRTTATKNIAKATKLKGPDGLVYTIDQDVTIASASSKENDDLSITTEPSTISVGITASDIGAQYNMGKNTEFTVANFDKSSFLARASEDITGGTSRKVSAVSKDDKQALESELRTQLKQQAQEQFKEEDQLIGAVPLDQENQTFTPQYSHDIGDEADTLEVDATLSLQYLTYKRSDLDKIIEQAVKDNIPQNFSLLNNQSEVDIKDISTSQTGVYQINALVQAKVSPTIDETEIISNIRGRFPEVTESYFKSLPGFSKVEIDIKPKLPPKLQTFPRVLKNITLILKINNP